MKHCMLDLETWGTAPGSALRSIGAVMFELDGQVGNKYYANISKQEQEGKLEFNQDTMDWWDRQGDEARQLLEKDPQSPERVILDFHQGFLSSGGVYLWGNGANFDPILWEAFCKAFGKQVPWRFYNVRCCRTHCAAFNFNPKKVPFEGVKHYALDDALHQVKYVQMAVKSVIPVVTNNISPEDVKKWSQPSNTFGIV